MQPPHSPIDIADKDDYPQLIQVWEGAVRATHDFLPDWYIARLKTLLLTQYLDNVTLLCTRDEDLNITGFAGVSKTRLEMLFIDPGHRGKGLGKQLLTHCVERFKIRELDVNEQNLQAQGFYRRQGFEVISRTELDGLGQPYPMLRMKLRQRGHR